MTRVVLIRDGSANSTEPVELHVLAKQPGGDELHISEALLEKYVNVDFLASMTDSVNDLQSSLDEAVREEQMVRRVLNLLWHQVKDSQVPHILIGGHVALSDIVEPHLKQRD